jgi:AcrR family transcriptional regulator
MAPRAYDMRRRARSVDASRQETLAAAHDLLADPKCRELSLDALARATGVTRATLYNRFGSRGALLVAIFHDLGQRMRAERVYAAMRLPEPEQALCATLRESTRAYARQQKVIRKLFALATLDSELSAEIERAERKRRQSLSQLAARLVASGDTCLGIEAAAALLSALTSFQAFEAMAFDSGPRLTERRLLELIRAGLGVSQNRSRVK